MSKLALSAFLATLVCLLAIHASSRAAAPTQYFGLYRAVVLEVADPSQEHRIRLDIPTVSTTVHPWARPCIPYVSGPPPAPPPVGTTVWVEFVAGDPNRPVWIGWSP